MATLSMLLNWSITLVLALACPRVAMSQAALCLDAIRSTARESGVPEAVLLAVARIESGRAGKNPLPAWPWAVNRAGDSQWHTTRREAETLVAAALARGEQNIDIGCLQINHRWHSQGFSSLSDMFDPRSNARYAAGFLQALYAEEPDWTIAVGKYHSRTPALAEAYVTRFQAALTTPPQGGDAPPKRAGNSFPLLNGGPAGVRGSTVPAVTGVGSLFFLQARRIIGD